MTNTVTLDEVEGEALDKIRGAINMRYTAWKREQEAKGIKANANEILLQYLPQCGYKRVTDDAIGDVTLVEGSRKHLNQDQLKEELLKRGVASQIIVDAFEQATSTNYSLSVNYRAPKEGE